MTDVTARWSLPLIAPGQAQKEMTHNEALARIDMIVGASVVAADVAVPPGDPAPGSAWIVADGASGAWTGQDRAIAGWTDGGWRFVGPRVGMLVWVAATGNLARFTGTAGWIVGAPLGAPQPAIAAPTGGTITDVEARNAINDILVRLQQFGLIQAP